MAITINYNTKVINIPKNDMTLIQTSPSEIRSLDMNTFHLALRNLEDSPEGMIHPPTHNHVAPINIGGVSLARVLEIINGYTITFENGSYFARLDNGNNNISDVVNLNNVSVISSNSAGLVFNDAIEDQSFVDGRVYINTSNGVATTNFPAGTPTSPVLAYSSAKIIAESKGFRKFELLGDIIFNNSEILDSYLFYGNSYNSSSLTFNNNFINGANFHDLTVDGIVVGSALYNNCFIKDLQGFAGGMKNCFLSDNITVSSINTNLIQIISCASAIAGSARPTLDINGANCPVSIRGYFGGLTISNFNQGNNMSIDVESGTIEISSSCTSGVILVRGLCQIIDNSNGATVISDGSIDKIISNNSIMQSINKNTKLIPATL